MKNAMPGMEDRTSAKYIFDSTTDTTEFKKYLRCNPFSPKGREEIAEYHGLEKDWAEGEFTAPTGTTSTPVYNLLFLIKANSTRTECVDVTEGLHRCMYITHVVTKSEVNDGTGEIVPNSLTGESMVRLFSDEEYEGQPNRDQLAKDADKELQKYIRRCNKDTQANNPLYKPVSIELGVATPSKKKKNTPTAAQLIKNMKVISQSIFEEKLACARPSLTKELGRCLVGILNSMDLDCQLQTLTSHGFYSTDNQIKIDRRTLQKCSSKLQEQFLSKGLNNLDIKNYMQDPFSNKHHEAARVAFAAKYDTLDEDSSDDDDDSSDDDDNEENGK